MSDRELEILRQRKLTELQRNLQKKVKTETEKNNVEDPENVLNRFFVDRAWEVFNAAKSQYPQPAGQIEKLLVKLIKEGKIREKIGGEELYMLFRRLGLKVRLETHIRVLEDGKVKSLEEKIREETLQ
jgi:DNA-binding TFAR19-related protein (PDSD5 family)